jgi:hypothetical protein
MTEKGVPRARPFLLCFAGADARSGENRIQFSGFCTLPLNRLRPFTNLQAYRRCFLGARAS